MDRRRGRWEGRVAAAAPEGVWDAMIRDGSMLGLDHTTKAPGPGHDGAFRRDSSETAEQNLMTAAGQSIDAEDKIAQLQHENSELSADVADLSKAVESLRASLNIVTANLQDSVQSLSSAPTSNARPTQPLSKSSARSLQRGRTTSCASSPGRPMPRTWRS